MSVNLVDTHCHINFFKNAGEIALECEKRKVHTIYVTTLPSQFDETFEYIKSLKFIHPSLGFHCLESDYNFEKEKRLFLKHVNNTKFIGEVGLDFSKRAIKSKDEQIELFEFVLKNIDTEKSVLNIHSSSAEDEVLKMLVQHDVKRAIFHWYSGKIGTLNKILDYGYYLSINEAMCKSNKGQSIIAKLPKNKILVETDAPFIKDVLPHKNYFVYSYLANLWNSEIESVKKLVLLNFNKLLNDNHNNLFT
ncbi:MAG: hypothetical protein KU37_09250 [Sulfuricurvum sp. PC08-66]|nr:MAG: hypothetical protein KU37_09250 [Sulfuricurvum sp. PC08-66]